MPAGQTPSPFRKLVSDRRSCRAYRPDPVPREHVETMLEAARLAPSACNCQPWRFAVVTSAEKRRALVQKGLLPGLSMDWAGDAPVVIALGMKRSFLTHQAAPALSGVDYPLLDLGIAGEHLVLRATELGLGTCWIGWIRPAGIRKIVGWGRDVKPVSLITVGWPALLEPEPRPRLAMEEIARWLE